MTATKRNDLIPVCIQAFASKNTLKSVCGDCFANKVTRVFYNLECLTQYTL